MTKEKAVEAGQLSQSAWSYSPQASVGFFEPHEPDDLTKKGRLYLIADAVAGTASTQVASRYAIQKVLHAFYTSTSSDLQQQLTTAIKLANTDIFEKNNQHPERRIMATTLMAAWIQDNKLLVASVGDNRAYVVWDQDIELLSQDVTPVRIDPEAGKDKKIEPMPIPVVNTADKDKNSDVSPAPVANKVDKDKSIDASSAPAKVETAVKAEPTQKPKLLTPRQRLPQALGFDPEVEVQLFSRKLFANDIVVLLSGGLTGYVEPKEVAQAVTNHSPEEASKQIIALARERGSRDQVTISITKILPETVENHSPVPMPLPTAPNWNDLAPSVKPTNGTSPLPASPKPATATQPLPEPKAVGAAGKPPVAAPQTSVTERMFGDPQLTKSFAEVFSKDKNKSRFYLIAGVWALLLCSSLFIIWRYVIPPETAASIPVLGSIDALVRDDEAGADETAAENGLAASGSLIEQEAAEVATPQRTLPAAESALVAESDSPIATPGTTFSSPVSTPAAGLAQGDTTSSARSSTVETLPPTPVPLPTIVLPADCANRARFYRDVTIPDGTQFAAGESFEKVWLLTNADTCPWGPGYTIRFVEGDPMGANRSIPVTERVEPETNGEIRVSMVAPDEPGEYRGVWQLHDLAGEPFGPEMYLEIEVLPADPAELVDNGSSTVLYDFIEHAGEATWSAGDNTYTPLATSVSEELEIPTPEGLVAKGRGLLRGNQESEQDVLLTYPDADAGFIEGKYQVDTPLEPTDALVANLGFTKLSILSDDGVIFEVVFTPDDGSEGVQILSTNVQYQDSPVSDIVPLTGIESGQTGTFTVRVLGGDSLSRDYAVWIDLRLVRQ
ncbi:MAG: protein phosphatase 2C domain-containing protein [Anaerolineae bacterium]|nr:protein phosphatase 2C domain-containing protein [Anaerolineae bacterium]MCB0222905.1 protein phosphatase 2C domain-containing protein [Anaerolineae bacterium]